MKKREYRSYGTMADNCKIVSKTVSKLDKAGIPKDSYRINYFSNSAELIVDVNVLEKVKTTLG